MELYHGTSARYIESILSEGIKPRNISKNKGNFAHTVSSAPGRVYLTNAYAPYFSMTATRKNESGLVLRVESCLASDMVADEDALEQVDRWHTKPAAYDMKTRTKHFIKKVQEFEDSGAFTWEKSIEALGTCAHNGTIPAKAITGYVIINPAKSFYVWDPTIALLNYAIMGEFYRQSTKYLFGDKNAFDNVASTRLKHSNIGQLKETIDEMVIERKFI